MDGLGARLPHKTTLRSLDIATVEALGRDLGSWQQTDAFGMIVVGPAWLYGCIADASVRRWAKSEDLWWRRAALVPTTGLNNKSRGGRGDAARTLAIVEMLIDDREDMIVKAVSWALRMLAPWNRRPCVPSRRRMATVSPPVRSARSGTSSRRGTRTPGLRYAGASASGDTHPGHGLATFYRVDGVGEAVAGEGQRAESNAGAPHARKDVAMGVPDIVVGRSQGLVVDVEPTRPVLGARLRQLGVRRWQYARPEVLVEQRPHHGPDIGPDPLVRKDECGRFLGGELPRLILLLAVRRWDEAQQPLVLVGI
ncbi:MAG: DNA alkylation repair protein [Devosia sp.]|nr:DNA alkylation repair protein [Devosia sp.]